MDKEGQQTWVEVLYIGVVDFGFIILIFVSFSDFLVLVRRENVFNRYSIVFGVQQICRKQILRGFYTILISEGIC